MELMDILIASIATLEARQRVLCVWPTLFLCTFFVRAVSFTSFFFRIMRA